MRRQERALLRTLLDSSSEGERLKKFLSPEILAEVEDASPLEITKFLSQRGWIDAIHYSWFAKPLHALPTAVRPLFLTLLNPKQAKEICTLLALPYSIPTYSSFMRPFLLDEFKKQVFQGVEVLDREAIPSSDLKSLISLRRNQLLSIVDLLGIYDLAADLRQIVDRGLLQKIYNALSEDQLTFLQYCVKQPLKWLPPKIGLLNWDGTKKTLQHLLHTRGLKRLGKALHDENDSLKWHLLHQFDTGRANVIEKVLRQRQDEALTPHFKSQVIHILKRYINHEVL